MKKFKMGCRGSKGGCVIINENDEIIYLPFIFNNQLYFLRIK